MVSLFCVFKITVYMFTVCSKVYLIGAVLNREKLFEEYSGTGIVFNFEPTKNFAFMSHKLQNFLLGGERSAIFSRFKENIIW
jgi:hypothetical protein